MNSEISDQNLNAELNEPHFDEEATLLAARPVVPLDEVKTARSKRGLALGLAITVGLLLGAATAVVIYRYLDGRQNVRIESASVESGAASEESQTQDSAGGSTVDPIAGSVAKSDETAPVSPIVESSKTQPPVERKPNTESRAAKQEGENDASPDDDDDESEKPLRRAERKRERQLQRQAERQARREARGRDTNSGSNDDLLRIREIFEGSPRP